MNLIKQKDDRGCCIACVAMLTDLTYEKIWRDQTGVWSPAQVLDFSPLEWTVYLNYLGFECDFVSIDGEAQEPLLDFLPIGVPYFCGIGLPIEHIKYDDRNAHAIVIDRNGKVLDPLQDDPGDLAFKDYRKAIFPQKVKTVFSVLDRRSLV
jgi:hypothetical protein